MRISVIDEWPQNRLMLFFSERNPTSAIVVKHFNGETLIQRIKVRTRKGSANHRTLSGSNEKVRKMNRFESSFKPTKKSLSACLLGIAALVGGASPALAQIAPNLGTASSFGALGGTGVTCTSPNPALPFITVTGNVGSLSVAPTTVTGFPALCSLSGTVQLGAVQAHTDLVTAYNKLASNLPADGYVCPSANASHNLAGDLLSGTQGASLEPGVYCIKGVGTLTSTLTLNGNGNSNAVWIFKGDSSLTPIGGATPALRSRVVMANGGNGHGSHEGSATMLVGDVLSRRAGLWGPRQGGPPLPRQAINHFRTRRCAGTAPAPRQQDPTQPDVPALSMVAVHRGTLQPYWMPQSRFRCALPRLWRGTSDASCILSTLLDAGKHVRTRNMLTYSVRLGASRKPENRQIRRNRPKASRPRSLPSILGLAENAVGTPGNG